MHRVARAEKSLGATEQAGIVLMPSNARAGAEDLPALDTRVLSALTLLDASPATSDLRAVIDTNRVAVHFVPIAPGLYARYSVARHTIEIDDRWMDGDQIGLAAEVDRTARAIYEQLEKNPAVLNTLRGGKFALDIGSIGGALALGGHFYALDLVLVPLATSLSHQLVELLGKQVVDAQREQTRHRQQELLKQHVSNPMSDWLMKWPATGGSSFERLQQALERIPGDVRRMDERVRALQS